MTSEIRDYKEYKEKLMLLEELVFKSCVHDENQIEFLLHQIESYENKNYPINKPTFKDALQFRLDQMNLDITEISSCFTCKEDFELFCSSGILSEEDKSRLKKKYMYNE